MIAGNAVTQLALYEPLYRARLRSERHTYRRNVFYGHDAGQALWKVLDGENAKGPVMPDYRTFNTDENCFWNPASEEGFVTYTLNSYTPIYDSANITAATQTPTTREQPAMTFEKWRGLVAAHVNSSAAGGAPAKSAEARSFWKDPAFVSPAEGDFRLQETSPVASWELSAEDTAGSQ